MRASASPWSIDQPRASANRSRWAVNQARRRSNLAMPPVASTIWWKATLPSSRRAAAELTWPLLSEVLAAETLSRRVGPPPVGLSRRTVVGRAEPPSRRSSSPAAASVASGWLVRPAESWPRRRGWPTRRARSRGHGTAARSSAAMVSTSSTARRARARSGAPRSPRRCLLVRSWPSRPPSPGPPWPRP